MTQTMKRPESKPLIISNRSALMRRFNQSFPPFYSQFVSGQIQAENLRLAYRLFQTKQAVVECAEERGKTVLLFAYRNQSFLLSDILGILTAFNLSIHNIHLYGQVYSPRLVFIRLVISRQQKPLSRSVQTNLCRAIHEALAGEFAVEELLATEFNFRGTVQLERLEFYLDPVFHLPAILVEADNEPGLFYQVVNALWQEDLLVININLMVRRERTRFILYCLGPNETLIPEYLGQKIAKNLQRRLTGQVTVGEVAI